MSLGERLKQLLSDNATSNYRLAKDLKINNTTVSNYIEDKVKKPNTLILEQIADYFKVSPEWLLKGEGNKNLFTNNIESTGSIEESKLKYLKNEFNSLPIEQKLNLLYKELHEIKKENTEKIDTISGALASLLLSVDEISDKMKKMDGE